MERYSRIIQKRPREIVLLRGKGCVYKKCAFCDYYSDSGEDAKYNFEVNKAALARVSGEFNELEVINSGSVFELDKKTLALIKSVCREKNISVIHFESHYLYKNKIAALREEFSDFTLKMKLGLESFDHDFRENVLKKGIKERSPEKIAENFDEANFLFGLSGQSLNSMRNDIRLGLKYFERICVNIMCENSSSLSPDKNVISIFKDALFPICKDDERVDILIENTDFGVG